MPSPPDEAGFAERQFSTHATPTEKRLAFWRDLFEQQAVRVDIQPRSNDTFNAQGSHGRYPVCASRPSTARRFACSGRLR